MEITFHGETTDEVISKIEAFLSQIKSLTKKETLSVPEKLAKWKAEKKEKAKKEEAEVAAPIEPAQKPDIFDLELPKPIDQRVVKNSNPKVKAFTKDEIRAELQKVMAKFGITKVQEILHSFGIDSISKLDSKRYHELMKVVEVTLQ